MSTMKHFTVIVSLSLDEGTETRLGRPIIACAEKAIAAALTSLTRLELALSPSRLPRASKQTNTGCDKHTSLQRNTHMMIQKSCRQIVAHPTHVTSQVTPRLTRVSGDTRPRRRARATLYNGCGASASPSTAYPRLTGHTIRARVQIIIRHPCSETWKTRVASRSSLIVTASPPTR